MGAPIICPKCNNRACFYSTTGDEIMCCTCGHLFIPEGGDK